MKYQYQLIVLGKSKFSDDIIKIFQKKINELGINFESIILIDKSNFKEKFKLNQPSFTLFFANSENNIEELNILDRVICNSISIIPIVENLDDFQNIVPKNISHINGFELNRINRIEALVSNILEGFHFLRKSRRIFISYKRSESSSIAIQLYEALEKNGFDVFLDTHSIRKSEPFQDELWHRMADSDVVLLLNTPNFLTSDWTKEELAKANLMSIGIVQLVWPNHEIESTSKISIPINLKKSNFKNSNIFSKNNKLKENILDLIIEQVESLRARTLKSRQNKIINEFILTIQNNGRRFNILSHNLITFQSIDNSEYLIIPSVGVPHAFTYNEIDIISKSIENFKIEKTFLLYDNQSIRDNWLKHLDWLNLNLPVEALKITEIEKWITKN